MLDCSYRECFSQVVFLIFDSFSVMNNTLSEHQLFLLRVFKAFDAFCSKNSIQYFACYGTLIGAIRHGGFIPWDDDFDVVMKREDYDRFINLRNQVGEGYRIASYQDGESPYPFAKFFSTEGTVWEYPQFPFIIGPWVDVFPLDKCQNGNRLTGSPKGRNLAKAVFGLTIETQTLCADRDTQTGNALAFPQSGGI